MHLEVSFFRWITFLVFYKVKKYLMYLIMLVEVLINPLLFPI